MEKIHKISLKLNFSPNTLDCYGLKFVYIRLDSERSSSQNVVGKFGLFAITANNPSSTDRHPKL